MFLKAYFKRNLHDPPKSCFSLKSTTNLTYISSDSIAAIIRTAFKIIKFKISKNYSNMVMNLFSIEGFALRFQ